ncbi:hypothetical protein BDZ91DRAFT_722603, partial [Kalaharituber pfeilii]
MVVFIKKGPGVTLACLLTNTLKLPGPCVLTPLLQFLFHNSAPPHTENLYSQTAF